MNCYIHDVPGRLRVRIPAAKGNPAAAAKLVNRLNTLQGITSVTANAITGSILIYYDTTVTDGAAFLEALDLQLMRQTDPPRRADRMNVAPPGRQLACKIVEAATWYVLERCLERCFPLILTALF